MHFSEIKTQSQFMEMADIWYQRLHRLREIWQDETQPKERKEKALKIWKQLYERVAACFQFAMILSQPKPPKNYKSGAKVITPNYK